MDEYSNSKIVTFFKDLRKMWSRLNDKTKNMIILFSTTFIFKIIMELGYWYILCKDTVTYTSDFNLIKYINGMVWCIFIFFAINNYNYKGKRASTFFLYFKYIFEIIPITIIYALGNDSSLYYNVLCLAYLLCVFIVNGYNIKSLRIKMKYLPFFIKLGFIVLVALMFIYIVLNNGLPTLQALNIYEVYELRESGVFKINKYMGYLLDWSACVILPFFLSNLLYRKKYVKAIIPAILIFSIYLYTGHKTFLFSIPLVIVCTLFSKRKNFMTEFFSLICSGAVFSILLYNVSRIFSSIYEMFGRRTMIVSANNKFKYFDFFSSNPKIGFQGVFPRWIIDIPITYDDIGHIISDVYYNNPNMNSNTGFLAEGYMRFGISGIFIELILFAIILIWIDKMQCRSDYQLAIGSCIYMIFRLSDEHLIGPLFFGTWMIMIIIIVLYRNTKVINLFDNLPKIKLFKKQNINNK